MNEQIKMSILKPRLSNFERVLEVISISLVLGVLWYLAFNLRSIPDRIPVHFGITGEVDRWGSKVSLIRVPIIMVIFYSFLTIVSRFPHFYNIPFTITEENAEMQYRNARLMVILLKVEIICLFAYTHYKAILIAMNKSSGLGGISIVGFLVIIFTTIIYFTVSMYKTDKKLKW